MNNKDCEYFLRNGQFVSYIKRKNIKGELYENTCD